MVILNAGILSGREFKISKSTASSPRIKAVFPSSSGVTSESILPTYIAWPIFFGTPEILIFLGLLHSF